jgi:hypothetical protein
MVASESPRSGDGAPVGNTAGRSPSTVIAGQFSSPKQSMVRCSESREPDGADVVVDRWIRDVRGSSRPLAVSPAPPPQAETIAAAMTRTNGATTTRDLETMKPTLVGFMVSGGGQMRKTGSTDTATEAPLNRQRKDLTEALGPKVSHRPIPRREPRPQHRQLPRDIPKTLRSRSDWRAGP